jgi:hypothetical protein
LDASSNDQTPTSDAASTSSESIERPHEELPTMVMLPPRELFLPENDDEYRMRNKVINEIINTERDYVNDLEMVIRLFLNPMREEKLLNDLTIATIFSNIELILGFNRVLLEDLIAHTKEHLGDKIGECFLKLVCCCCLGVS